MAVVDLKGYEMVTSFKMNVSVGMTVASALVKTGKLFFIFSGFTRKG